MAVRRNEVVGEWCDETGIVARSTPVPESAAVSEPARMLDPSFEGDGRDAPMRSDVNLRDRLDAAAPDEAMHQAAAREAAGREATAGEPVTSHACGSSVSAFVDVASDSEAGEEELDRVVPSGTRVSEIWREWLYALATDSEAAMATAMAYRQFPDDVRDEWISALEMDLHGLPVSPLAVFAPLLAVETDTQRRLRIAQLLQPGFRETARPGREEYLRALLDDGSVVSLIVSPLYLDFVQVLACAYRPGERFLWVRHDPIAHRNHLGAAREALSGIELEATPGHVVVDELACTVVAANRRQEPLPEALSLFAHLFSPGH